jgi:hypothetical protein
MRLLHAIVSCVLASTACASHDGHEPEIQTPTVQRVELRAAIASVQLAQDCPDGDQAAAAMPPSESSAKQAPGAALRGDSPDGGWSPPCRQSTVQLTVSHDGKETLPFELKAMRLTQAGQGGVLATVPFRKPSQWTKAERYEAWDSRLAPGGELKISYDLGEPDWSLVAKTLGTDDTYGKRYVLEVDISFGGRSITVRSPEFEREYPEVIVT